MERLVLLTITFIALLFISILFCVNASNVKAIQNFTEITKPQCKFSYNQSQNDPLLQLCFEPITQIGNEISEHNVPMLSNQSVITDSVTPTINMHNFNSSKIWKSKVSFPLADHANFDNVGEPSFASNGTLVFYAGNHYTARSIIGKNWEYVDPNFDFKGIEGFNQTSSSNSTVVPGKTISIFKADQHIEFDPYRKMYLWIRQGDRVSYSDSFANIDRLAISKDTVNWNVFDMISTQILNKADIFNAVFDYPDTAITKKYFYLTTTVYDTGEHKKYGLILRIPLDDLSYSFSNSSAKFSYDVILDRDVESITPVKGSSDPMYFGAQLPNGSSTMKVYDWKENSAIPNSVEIPIKPWNSINNQKICSLSSETWWCKANTNSRIRSAWMFNNSINFMWNALRSYNNGTSWLPYVDSATIYLNKNIHSESKYQLADDHTAWIFGAAAPTNRGNLGVIAFYYNVNNAESHLHPYLTLAFGQYNTTNNKWEMMPIVNSSASLPVKSKDGNDDYNIGDFLTIKDHKGRDQKYQWDMSGYVIVGGNYFDTNSYFLMVR